MPQASDNPMELLNAAVSAKSAIAVVATDGSGKSLAAQFVAPAKPTDAGFVWARPAVKQTDTSKHWAAVKARVSIRFTLGQVSAGAEAVMVKQIRDYWLTETLPVSAFLLDTPTRVWVDQREHTRYQLRNDGGGIRATLARTPSGTLAKPPGAEARASLWDLGLGGAGFLCPFNRVLIETAPNHAFDVTLLFSGRQAVLPGHCTFAKAQGNLLRIGIEFDESITSIESMTLLRQVVVELEQREARFERRIA